MGANDDEERIDSDSPVIATLRKSLNAVVSESEVLTDRLKRWKEEDCRAHMHVENGVIPGVRGPVADEVELRNWHRALTLEHPVGLEGGTQLCIDILDCAGRMRAARAALDAAHESATPSRSGGSPTATGLGGGARILNAPVEWPRYTVIPKGGAGSGRGVSDHEGHFTFTTFTGDKIKSGHGGRGPGPGPRLEQPVLDSAPSVEQPVRKPKTTTTYSGDNTDRVASRSTRTPRPSHNDA